MSQKSTGMHLLVPEKEVQEYSELLNSYYEMLHRSFCSLIKLPDDIDSLNLLLKMCCDSFFSIRELLEEDYGIHPYTAKILKVPDCGELLQQITKWEENIETAKYEYIRRLNNEDDKSAHSIDYIFFWKDLRIIIWNIERCLNISRTRIKSNNQEYPTENLRPNYYWQVF